MHFFLPNLVHIIGTWQNKKDVQLKIKGKLYSPLVFKSESIAIADESTMVE
jgi:hypothetical protein